MAYGRNGPTGRTVPSRVEEGPRTDPVPVTVLTMVVKTVMARQPRVSCVTRPTVQVFVSASVSVALLYRDRYEKILRRRAVMCLAYLYSTL